MIKDYSLLQHNTFGIDVRARYFAEYASVDELKEILREYQLQLLPCSESAFCKEYPDNTKNILHIGGGSNLLFLKDFDGLVLHNAIRGIEVLEDNGESIRIKVGGGMVWDDLVAETIGRGWYGLENLSLIPGEVGASAVQNIGAYGSEAKDYIVRVHLLDLQSLESLTKEVGEMDYAYRYSWLKSGAAKGKYAVTYVEYQLSHTFQPRIEYGGLRAALLKHETTELTATLLRQVIIEMRNGKLPDPKVLGNAGSFFMNPVVERSVFDRLFNKYPEMPHYEVDANHVKIPAGWLIEQSGWKGRKLGNAGVYERQALVLVNHGGATGQEIVNLCNAVRADVKEMFGIDIHPEVNLI